MGSLIIIGLIALGVAGAITAVALIFMGDNEKLDDRLADLTRNRGRGVSSDAGEAGDSSFLRSPLEDAPNFVEDSMKGVINAFNLRKFIDSSGVEMSVSNFLIITIGLLIGVTVLSALFLPAGMIWAAPAAGALAAVFPYLFVAFKRGRRMKRFSSQLPQALDLMSQALRAGQSLPAGIQLVGEQLPDPLGPEFHTAYHEQNLGATIVESLESMCSRVPDLDLRFFATAVTLQRQTGCLLYTSPSPRD